MRLGPGVLAPLLCCFVCDGPLAADSPAQRTAADDVSALPWQLAFADPCTAADQLAWQQDWFLDGDQAAVGNSDQGLRIDATDGFAVLWTKREFTGDLRIEYDFQRLDAIHRGVNIIYIQARGDDQDGHHSDISMWSARRRNARMSDYYMNMHTYHISYAAYPQDYIRGRRYLPIENNRLQGTELSGEKFDTGLFDDQQWLHVTIIKRPQQLSIKFDHPDHDSLLCRLHNEDKPPIEAGRIGLRLMPGRISQFKNFRVFERQRVATGVNAATGGEQSSPER